MAEDVIYGGSTTILDARARYFDRAGFDADGGYAAKWVKLKIGPLFIAFPNSKSRVRSVKLHDVHHILTEYETTWRGEAEIAAWEIASGCRDHYVAWLLNFAALAIGLLIAPVLTFRAFVRGRHSRNLYDRDFDPAMLQCTVGELRKTLDISAVAPAAGVADVLAFAWLSAVAVAVTVAPYLGALAAVVAVFVFR